MKSLIKKILISVSIAAFSAAPGALIAAGAAHAQSFTGSNVSDGVCQGINNTQTADQSCTDNGGSNSFSGLAQRVINIFSIVVGAVSVVMIIIGGFRYIISGGDSNGVTGAKNTILYAIVGLVIVLFAQIIVKFVFTNVSKQ